MTAAISLSKVLKPMAALFPQMEQSIFKKCGRSFVEPHLKPD
jgi:hypothetical protein